MKMYENNFNPIYYLYKLIRLKTTSWDRLKFEMILIMLTNINFFYHFVDINKYETYAKNNYPSISLKMSKYFF